MEIDCPIPVISIDMNDLWMKSDLDFKKIYAKSAKSARPQRTTTKMKCNLFACRMLTKE